MSGYKRKIEEHKISDNLMHIISISTDEEKLFLNVEYRKNFKIEKNFKNNSIGLMDLQMIRESLNDEEKVSKYLGIGEINE